MTINKIWITGGLIFGVLILGAVLGLGWLKSEIEKTEFTESSIEENVVIGNDALIIPQNYFRFKAQRNSSVLKQADLVMSWPAVAGYSQDNKEQFQDGRSLIFATIKKRELAQDMNSRFEPIYKKLLDGTSSNGPSGITLYNFKNNVGYNGEQLAVSQVGERIWVARCYKGESSVQSTCMHDMNMGKALVVIYRFNSDLLPQWQKIHDQVTQKLTEMIVP